MCYLAMDKEGFSLHREAAPPFQCINRIIFSSMMRLLCRAAREGSFALFSCLENVRFVHVLYVRYTVTISTSQCTKTDIARSRERKRTSHAVQRETLEGCGCKGNADRVWKPSHRGAYRPRQGEMLWGMGRVNRFFFWLLC